MAHDVWSRQVALLAAFHRSASLPGRGKRCRATVLGLATPHVLLCLWRERTPLFPLLAAAPGDEVSKFEKIVKQLVTGIWPGSIDDNNPVHGGHEDILSAVSDGGIRGI